VLATPSRHFGVECTTLRCMGLLSRLQNIFRSSSSESSDHQHRRRAPADPAAEQAEVQETVGRDGALSPRIAGVGPKRGFAVNDPIAADKIRMAADPEDDGAAAMAIEKERRDAEHGE